MARLEPRDVAWFTNPDELRAWLAEHHASAQDLWAGFRPKTSGLPTISWPQLVDEVLCFGWIDSVRMPVEGGSAIRITPRRDGSIWSARNVGRVEALRVEGRMTSAGEAAFAKRRDDRTAIYAFEQNAQLDAEAEAAMRADAQGWAFWEAQPAGYRRLVTHRVMSAKRDETRAKRLAALVEACARSERLP
ncbi:MAG: YdeI/OmpD-associated family protein [Candidatus Limnocylindrales bacterium]